MTFATIQQYVEFRKDLTSTSMLADECYVYNTYGKLIKEKPCPQSTQICKDDPKLRQKHKSCTKS
eukprot:CAMPEP_0181315016 /NCGR_PEP_ID=MMETSP1101-20121128/15138_1 /TAXON_ID=46948 /ORGANISM="Rhodomonas abbreviata, Strain Caron Lab Isolate" /LENGTH=64 /DNA_ID=CAMNT_0023422171 /DNA_START=231 /DNA_END=425 /DNA_ORIENTATION=+